MDTAFESRLRAAVSAGWRVLLVEVGFVTLVWLVYLGIMAAHPSAMRALFGPDVSWSAVATVTLLAVAVFKVALWLQASLLLWAWLWAVMLRRQRAADARRRTESASGAPPPAASRAVSARA
jgi:hypothetical protein